MFAGKHFNILRTVQIFFPCDFHIFGDLKKDIRRRQFHSDEEMKEWVRLWIHQRPTSLYKTEITVYEEQLETKFSRETENVFTLSLYYGVGGIGATRSSMSVKETVEACSTVYCPLISFWSPLSIYSGRHWQTQALPNCHKCGCLFFSTVKTHPLKIPPGLLEKGRAGSSVSSYSS